MICSIHKGCEMSSSRARMNDLYYYLDTSDFRQGHWLTASLCHCITALLYHCVTSPPHHYITEELYHCITASFHHSITESLHQCITVSMHICITASSDVTKLHILFLPRYFADAETFCTRYSFDLFGRLDRVVP